MSGHYPCTESSVTQSTAGECLVTILVQSSITQSTVGECLVTILVQSHPSLSLLLVSVWPLSLYRVIHHSVYCWRVSGHYPCTESSITQSTVGECLVTILVQSHLSLSLLLVSVWSLSLYRVICHSVYCWRVSGHYPCTESSVTQSTVGECLVTILVQSHLSLSLLLVSVWSLSLYRVICHSVYC